MYLAARPQQRVKIGSRDGGGKSYNLDVIARLKQPSAARAHDAGHKYPLPVGRHARPRPENALALRIRVLQADPMDKFEDLVPEERSAGVCPRSASPLSRRTKSVQASRWPVYDGGGPWGGSHTRRREFITVVGGRGVCVAGRGASGAACDASDMVPQPPIARRICGAECADSARASKTSAMSGARTSRSNIVGPTTNSIDGGPTSSPPLEKMK